MTRPQHDRYLAELQAMTLPELRDREAEERSYRERLLLLSDREQGEHFPGSHLRMALLDQFIRAREADEEEDPRWR